MCWWYSIVRRCAQSLCTHDMSTMICDYIDLSVRLCIPCSIISAQVFNHVYMQSIFCVLTILYTAVNDSKLRAYYTSFYILVWSLIKSNQNHSIKQCSQAHKTQSTWYQRTGFFLWKLYTVVVSYLSAGASVIFWQMEKETFGLCIIISSPTALGRQKKNWRCTDVVIIITIHCVYAIIVKSQWINLMEWVFRLGRWTVKSSIHNNKLVCLLLSFSVVQQRIPVRLGLNWLFCRAAEDDDDDYVMGVGLLKPKTPFCSFY